MSAPEIQSEKLIIVLVGKFNPQIFQPFWFAKQGLVREIEAEKASEVFVHAEISDFSFEWCHFNVSTERLVLDCSRPELYPALFDLITSTLTLLSHTPIKALGINLRLNYRFSEVKDWHDFGDRIAPKAIWGGILPNPGLVNLQMKADKASGIGSHNVTVQSAPPRDIIVHINDHFQLDSDTAKGISLTSLLDEQRTVSLENSKKMSSELVIR